jgi:hypothetical protein
MKIIIIIFFLTSNEKTEEYLSLCRASSGNANNGYLFNIGIIHSSNNRLKDADVSINF